MTAASDYVEPRGRFARSVNIERDAGAGQLDGYLPTGRALDVVGRVTRAIVRADASTAFSITGPYGTGKSSLAVFLDALLAPRDADEHAAALAILAATDPDTAQLIEASPLAQQGFVRAVVTASREPIAATVVRALHSGAQQFRPHEGKQRFRRLQRELATAAEGLSDRNRALPSNRFIVDAVTQLAAHAPVLLVIDEFGKNLEAFTDSRSEADLYLLQELAEWSHTSTDGRLSLLMVTMQHLAFEEYLDTVSQTLRREWAKVQGRFEDIPYVDSPAQTQHLIAQVHQHSPDPEYLAARQAWADAVLSGLRDLGLGHHVDERVVADAWPLHPSTLLVLPELCARYGQNERTLFSFLASSEPLAVPAWLHEATVGEQLGDVRLDRVYDYFVESAATMVGAAQTASRWVEIETSIRDTTNLSEAHRRVLKAVGLLNLVSAGGTTRASRAVLTWACADGQPGTETAADVEALLTDLERTGRLTYREFADELRLWRGSDIDIRAAVTAARRRLAASSAEELLTAARPMSPVVAARHSIETGTLRAFARTWDSDGRVIPPGPEDHADGLLVYVVGDSIPTVARVDHTPKPVVAVRPEDTEALLQAAVDLTAIREVLNDPETIGEDWVARRELTEREAEALVRFDSVFERTVGHNAGDNATWYRLRTTQPPEDLPSPVSVASLLSDVCDQVYDASPPVANEMLNRHELTSQGTKARRLLLESLLARPSHEHLGIDGFPPQRAMYDAVFATTGMHRVEDGGYVLGPPRTRSGWKKAWNSAVSMLELAKEHRVGIEQIIDTLASPPVGLKIGVAPALIVAAILVHRDEIALYEHGTYTPRFTDDVLERFLRNPAHFQIKHYAATRGPRRRTVELVADALGIQPLTGAPTVLSVVGHLVATANSLPGYARQTSSVTESAAAVRKALYRATEPDVLLFNTLPEALGYPTIPARRRHNPIDPAAFAAHLTEAVHELESIRRNLVAEVIDSLRAATGSTSEDHRAELHVRAEHLQGRVIDQRMRGLISALVQPMSTDEEWAEYVAMAVTGPPIDSWTDDTRQQYLANITELGATLRRLEAINFDRRARDEKGFDALRVTITRSDGAEEARVVGVTDDQRARLEPLLDRLVDEASSQTVEIETILALLGERLLPDDAGLASHPAGTVDATGTTD